MRSISIFLIDLWRKGCFTGREEEKTSATLDVKIFNFQLYHKNTISKRLDLDRRRVLTSPGQSLSVSHPKFDVILNNWQASLCSSRKMREWSRTHKKQPRKITQNGTAEATSLTSRLKNHCSLQDKMHPLFMVYGRSEKQHKRGSQLLERVDR